VVQTIGFAAAIIGAFAFLPQVVKTWRSGSARDLSLATLAALSTGAGLWVVYGAAIGSVPVVAGNTITVSLALTLLVLKVRDKP
jgi:MtN3 and saliva related transmembrane protein